MCKFLPPPMSDSSTIPYVVLHQTQTQNTLMIHLLQTITIALQMVVSTRILLSLLQTTNERGTDLVEPKTAHNPPERQLVRYLYGSTSTFDPIRINPIPNDCAGREGEIDPNAQVAMSHDLSMKIKYQIMPGKFACIRVDRKILVQSREFRNPSVFYHMTSW